VLLWTPVRIDSVRGHGTVGSNMARWGVRGGELAWWKGVEGVGNACLVFPLRGDWGFLALMFALLLLLLRVCVVVVIAFLSLCSLPSLGRGRGWPVTASGI
jgi:hypothetical protein